MHDRPQNLSRIQKWLLNLIKLSNILFIMIVFISCLVFYGCPYGFKVALSNKNNAKIDKCLIGKWFYRDENTTVCLTISKLNINEYVFVLKLQDDVIAGKAFCTQVNDSQILNVYGLKGESNYYFFKYVVQNGVSLNLKTIDEIGVDNTYNNSEELYSFVEKHLKDKNFFSEMGTLSKGDCPPNSKDATPN